MSWVGVRLGEGGNPPRASWGSGFKISENTDFPGGTVDRNLFTNAWDMGSILGRFHTPRSN